MKYQPLKIQSVINFIIRVCQISYKHERTCIYAQQRKRNIVCFDIWILESCCSLSLASNSCRRHTAN